jgi:hypothetical protein
MDCHTAAELIDLLAEGEIERAGDLAAHLDTCPQCAAGLEAARLVNQWLVGGRAHAPRHFTATVLQHLPARSPRVPLVPLMPLMNDVDDALESWFDSMATLSLVPVIIGMWLLVDPAILRRIVDTTTVAASTASAALLQLPALMPAYVAIAVLAVIAALSLDFEDA